MNKTIKIWKIIADIICGLLSLIGFVLLIFADVDGLAILLMALGGFGFVLIYGFPITKKYIKSNNTIGRRVRICYAVGFLLVITSIILMWTGRDSSFKIQGYLIFFGLWGTASYLSGLEKTEDFLLEEEARKRKFEEEDDDLESV